MALVASSDAFGGIYNCFGVGCVCEKCWFKVGEQGIVDSVFGFVDADCADFSASVVGPDYSAEGLA